MTTLNKEPDYGKRVQLMSLSTLALVLFIFLQSAALLGWFSVSATFLGIVGIIFVVLRLLEGFGAYSYSVPVARRHPAE